MKQKYNRVLGPYYRKGKKVAEVKYMLDGQILCAKWVRNDHAQQYVDEARARIARGKAELDDELTERAVRLAAKRAEQQVTSRTLTEYDGLKVEHWVKLLWFRASRATTIEDSKVLTATATATKNATQAMLLIPDKNATLGDMANMSTAELECIPGGGASSSS